MSRSLFPGYIKTFEQAIAHVDDWVRNLGGERLDGLEATQSETQLHVKPFHVEFPTFPGIVLKVSFRIGRDLAPAWYSFDLRRGAILLWRLDMHPGHEREQGTPCHLHIGPEETNRFPTEQVSLLEVSDRLHRTLR